MKTQRLSMDVYAGMFLLLLGAVFYFLALDLTDEAAIFPRIVLWAFMILSAGMAVQGYLKFKKTGEAKNPLALEGLRVPAVILVLITLYVVAMDFLGFALATAGFIPAVALFYKNKKPLHILAATVCLIGFIYLLFVVQLKLVLP